MSTEFTSPSLPTHVYMSHFLPFLSQNPAADHEAVLGGGEGGGGKACSLFCPWIINQWGQHGKPMLVPQRFNPVQNTYGEKCGII